MIDNSSELESLTPEQRKNVERSERQANAWRAFLKDPEISPDTLSRILVDPSEKYFPLGPAVIETQLLAGLSGAINSAIFNIGTKDFLPQTAKGICSTITQVAHIDTTQNRGQVATQMRNFAQTTLHQWTENAATIKAA